MPRISRNSSSLDACFDAGHITFDDEGRIRISTLLSDQDAEALGIPLQMRLKRITPQHKVFLEYHRAKVFEKKLKPRFGE
jgi:putative restriction endonuclease